MIGLIPMRNDIKISSLATGFLSQVWSRQDVLSSLASGIKCIVGDGSNTKFWEDPCISKTTLKDILHGVPIRENVQDKIVCYMAVADLGFADEPPPPLGFPIFREKVNSIQSQ
ncbi:hypothetical protein ACFE04_004328 [Oxalis oulophora]